MQILYYDKDNCLVTEQVSYATYGAITVSSDTKRKNTESWEALIIRCNYNGYVIVTDRDKDWCERAIERLFDSGKLDLRTVTTQVVTGNMVV